jgi:hypothetical protein
MVKKLCRCKAKKLGKCTKRMREYYCKVRGERFLNMTCYVHRKCGLPISMAGRYHLLNIVHISLKSDREAANRQKSITFRLNRPIRISLDNKHWDMLFSMAEML